MPTEPPIYLDYQASTPVDPRVRAAVLASLDADFANPSSEGHAFGWQAAAAVETARAQVAQLLNALPEEIIFTSGATEADNLGVIGAALNAPPQRRRILISAIEHKAVLEAARACEPFGFQVEEIAVSADGRLDLADLQRRLGRDVAVVSVMAVNNEIGTIQPIAEVAELAAAAGAFVHTDATQAPLAMAVDVLAWNVDAASFSAHKLYGPKGVGALYLSASPPWRPRPLMHGGGQEQGLRPGTVPTPLCVGFGIAAEILRAHPEERDRVANLRDRFATRLRTRAPAAQLTCAASPRHPGNLHVRFPGHDANDLLHRLQPRVGAATGSACTSGLMGPSHVLLALGWEAAAVGEAVRFSVGRFTTAEEVDSAADAIADVLERLAEQAV